MFLLLCFHFSRHPTHLQNSPQLCDRYSNILVIQTKQKGDITAKGFAESSGKDVLKQTLVLSFAIRSPILSKQHHCVPGAYTGVRFKLSILRGEYDNSTKNALDKIKALQDIRLRHLDKVITGFQSKC